jgi:hypothetical protein
LDYGLSFRSDGSVIIGKSHEFEGVVERRQWVSEFVSQRRQKIISVTVSIDECPLKSVSLDQICGMAGIDIE